MANKKISEFPVTTSLAGSDSFLMNHLGTTSTVAFSSLSAAISTIVNTFIPTQVYDSVPIGSVHFFATSAAPTGYLECDGSVVSKSTYNDLYLVIKDTFSSPVSTNHFRLPDLRGEFIRGWDAGRNVDTGRVFGSSQDATGIDNRPAKYTLSDPNTNQGEIEINYTNADSTSTTGSAPWQKSADWAVNQTSTFFTTRPRNIALLPCIKSQKQLVNLQ